MSEVTVAAAAAGPPPAAAIEGQPAPEALSAPDVRFGPDGLVPAIVQDAADARVLMLAWMDIEALDATVESGQVHFHSRSRDRLWRKGETSGNVLRLVSLAPDCDGDALLVTVDPVGPTCHRGTRSCFDPEDAAAGFETLRAPGRPASVETLGSPSVPESVETPGTPGAPAHRAAQGFAWLEELWATIASRAAERPSGSYTTSLLDGGVDAVGRKVTEEATELLLAAKDDATATTPATREALAAEAADLLYHALVLLAERDLPPSEVIATLRSRHDP